MVWLFCSIHVRRTDKVGAEAAFHSIDEYMSHVEDYYNTREKQEHIDRRRVYIASDDSSVIDDAKHRSVSVSYRNSMIHITFQVPMRGRVASAAP